MPVPLDFQFSQGSLQDYVDCPRRFQLRYMQRVAWPAVEAEPLIENERHRKMGELFHLLAQQLALGLPEDRLSRTAAYRRLGGAELESWWQNYLTSGIVKDTKDRPVKYYPEISLAGCVGGACLTAKYDGLQVRAQGETPSITILDWKTSRQRPRRPWLAERLQTRVYLFLMVQSGAFLTGKKSLPPEQVEMIYWFAGFPDNPEKFTYSAGQYQEDGAYLSSLICGLQAGADEKFACCAGLEACKFCVYRSLCERGVEPGVGLDVGGGVIEPEVNLDFDQIAEIEF